MGNEDYNNKLEVIREIEESQIQQPHHIPVAVYIQEADTLYHWIQDDKEALIAAGLAWDLVEDLPTRIGALVTAEAVFQRRWKNGPDSQRELNNRFPVAEDLKKKLLNDFRFAFKKHPLLMKTIRENSRGESRASVIQTLNDLSELGKANLDLLAAINFDISLLDNAAQTSDELAKLVAAATTDMMKPNETADIRDRAYSHLKEAVDIIRGYGKYVSYQNKERFTGYISQYIRRLRIRQARKPKGKGAVLGSDE